MNFCCNYQLLCSVIPCNQGGIVVFCNIGYFCSQVIHNPCLANDVRYGEIVLLRDKLLISQFICRGINQIFIVFGNTFSKYFDVLPGDFREVLA